jgi:hypothetical protein
MALSDKYSTRTSLKGEMMSNKTNLALDLTMFAAFLAIYNPRLTSHTIHEWLGTAFAAAIVTHVLLHWNWVVTIAGQFVKKLFHQSRLNFVVDALFFIAITGAMFSGLLISKEVLSTVGIQLGQVSRGWKSVHIVTSDAALILLGIHFALHWKWVVVNSDRYIVTPLRGLFQRRALNPLAVQAASVKIDGDA